MAESITDGFGVQRWSVDRRPDGSYVAHLVQIGREGLKERDIQGSWYNRDGVVFMDPALDDSKVGAWRYESIQTDCLRMEAVEPSTGKPLKPGLRYGECRSLLRWSLPERTRYNCVLDKPLFPKRSEVDFRIALESDGKRYATGDGKREPVAVDVRDYPILRDFDPRKPETMTNAGEALLMLIQSSFEKDTGFARTLGFDPGKAKGARIYVLSPPRPHRPMEYYSAGRNSLLEAFDGDGKLLGVAMYSPFIVACPRVEDY